jgi:hypothetical protein
MMRGARVGSDGATSERLQQWLLAHWREVDALTIDDAISGPEGSGYSATTMIVPVTVTRGGETGQQIRDAATLPTVTVGHRAFIARTASIWTARIASGRIAPQKTSRPPTEQAQ